MKHTEFVKLYEDLEKLCKDLGGLHVEGNDQDEIMLVRDNGTTAASWKSSGIKRALQYVRVRLEVRERKKVG